MSGTSYEQFRSVLSSEVARRNLGLSMPDTTARWLLADEATMRAVYAYWSSSGGPVPEPQTGQHAAEAMGGPGAPALGGPSSGTRRVPARWIGLGLCAACLVVVALIALSRGTGRNAGNEDLGAGAAETSEVAAQDYVEEGYGNHNGDWSVVYRFLDDRDVNWPSCDYGTCAAIEVVAVNGCSSMFAEANFLSPAEIVLGDSIDSVDGLSAGGKAVLSFVSSEDNIHTVQVTSITCRR